MFRQVFFEDVAAGPRTRHLFEAAVVVDMVRISIVNSSVHPLAAFSHTAVTRFIMALILGWIGRRERSVDRHQGHVAASLCQSVTHVRHMICWQWVSTGSASAIWQIAHVNSSAASFIFSCEMSAI